MSLKWKQMLHHSWRMTSGVAPDAVKAARPVLNGEDEETDREVLRLVLTQHWDAVEVFARATRRPGQAGYPLHDRLQSLCHTGR